VFKNTSAKYLKVVCKPVLENETVSGASAAIHGA